MLALEADNVFSAYWVARAEIENPGFICLINKAIQDCTASGDSEKLHRELFRIELATRTLSASRKWQIQTIEFLEAIPTEMNCSFIRDSYKMLCDYCHPNYQGTIYRIGKKSAQVYLKDLAPEDLLFIPCLELCAQCIITIYDIIVTPKRDAGYGPINSKPIFMLMLLEKSSSILLVALT